MFVLTPTLQFACVAAMATLASVNAHGYMSVPKVTFATSGDPTQFCATMDGPTTLTAPSGMRFTTDPASNTKAFTAALKASKYDSVRALVEAKAEFVSGMNKECGVTSATGAKQPLPAQYVEWAHSSSEGFTPSHQGPCEVWCDKELAFSNENCAANYKSAPAKLPYDKSKCTGASMLKIYWLALHSSTWQVYINCAPLSGGGSATTPVVAPSSTPKKGTPSVKPATTTRASTKPTNPATTKTPSKTPSTTRRPNAGRPSMPTSETGADADDEDCEDDLDIADETPTPVATRATKAPSRGKTPKPTKKAKSRSMEYGFDELNEEN